VKLTSCSMMAVRRCRRRAAMRSGRDHGFPPGRGCGLGCVPSREGTASWGPGSAKERKEGEVRTDSARKMAAAERFTSAAAELARRRRSAGEAKEVERDARGAQAPLL
jgi:hypothetical protein